MRPSENEIAKLKGMKANGKFYEIVINAENGVEINNNNMGRERERKREHTLSIHFGSFILDVTIPPVDFMHTLTHTLTTCSFQ